MKRLILAAALIALAVPLAAQQFSLRERLGKALPLQTQGVSAAASVIGKPGQCLAYTDGTASDVCVAPAGNGYYVQHDIVLQGAARYYGTNGMAVTAGTSSIYLGDPYSKGGVVIGPGGMAVKGKLAMIGQDGLSKGYPVLSDSGLAVFVSEEDKTTGDKGSTSVELPSQLVKIANVNPATKGSYVVLCFSRDPAEVVSVSTHDMFADHFVARSKSGHTVAFGYMIFAEGDGFTPPVVFKTAPDASAVPPSPDTKPDLLRDLRNSQ